ncbi:MAG TPA: FUSC family protein, partial [Burkholderiaceae bacterium]|nr:FUSC family protein [Burkholderiaceae bacterium]
MNLAWRPRFTRAEIVFSLKSYAAAMLALYVASRAGLPRPFWAMLTSYVVAAPLAGNVRSKALYRFLGTLIGCTATVLLVPALADAPELSALALALWVGGCLFLSLQDRTARAYVFMLAGYTAALIGFPSIETPSALFDNAVARVEEIGLGILCATLVHSLVFPVGLGPTLLGLLDRSLADARGWLVDLMQPHGPEPGNVAFDRHRLAGDITQLRLLSHHLPFDTSHLRWTVDAIGSMQDGLAGLTPMLSAVEDRLQALAQVEGTLAPDVAALLAEVAQWLACADAPARDARLASLRTTLERFGTSHAGQPASDLWGRALRVGLAVRLDELVSRWQACERLRMRIDAGLAGAPTPLRRTPGVGNAALHKDRGLALLSAFAAVLAICLCCAAWIATAWPSGSGAAMMAAVFCSFFAAQDDPVPAINGFLKFTLVSVPISAFYVLVLLPAVHDFGMLVLVCAPTFLLLGFWIGRASTFAAAMATLFGVAGTLSMHDTATVVDLPGYVNSILAQVLGIGAAA